MKYLLCISMFYFIISCSVSGMTTICDYPNPPNNICKTLVAVEPGESDMPTFDDEVNKNNKKHVVPDKINYIKSEIAGGSMELLFVNGKQLMSSSGSMTVIQWDENLAHACFDFIISCTYAQFGCEGLNALNERNTNHNVTFVSYEYDDKTTNVDETIWKAFEHGAQSFDYNDSLTYSKNEAAEFFTMIARHDSLFVGCMTTVEKDEPFKNLLICAFAPAWDVEHGNNLYIPGDPCSECPFKGHNCSELYSDLCNRPNNTFFEDVVQNSNFTIGFVKDPCRGFEEKNSICIPNGSDNYTCECNEKFYPIEDDACNGCADPCYGFNASNSICYPHSFDNVTCECEPGTFSTDGNACQGCEDPCINFEPKNSKCIGIGPYDYRCDCIDGFYPIELEACNGCGECPYGYEYWGKHQCLIVKLEEVSWTESINYCHEENAASFTPLFDHPILPREFDFQGRHEFWVAVGRYGMPEDYWRWIWTNNSYIYEDSPLWMEGEPSYGVEKCVLYDAEREGLGDITCVFRNYPYICQAPVAE